MYRCTLWENMYLKSDNGIDCHHFGNCFTCLIGICFLYKSIHKGYKKKPHCNYNAVSF